MDFVNAIAKVRFGTAKPQHVQLHKGEGLLVELLCMESGQELTVKSGEWAYYVVTGMAAMTCDGQVTQVPAGQSAAAASGEVHTIANAGEGRLVIVAVGHGR